MDFPLVKNKIIQVENSDDLTDSSSLRRNTIAQTTSNPLQKTDATRRDTLPPKMTKPLFVHPQPSYQLLHINKPTAVRSSEFLNEPREDEPKRRSYDNLHVKRPGTGRKLPSIEFAESQQAKQHHSFERSISYGNKVLSPNKRGHLLCRLAAFDIPTVPKQASSPLPHEAHRIYDPHHINSRSWNDDYQPQEQEKPVHGGVQVTAVVRGTSSTLFPRSDHSSSSTSSQRVPVLSPVSPYQPSPLSTCSTGNFKVDSDRPDTLARECQDLWRTRRSLAHDYERPTIMSLLTMNNTSTDIASDDPSTSFESNTIAVDATLNESKQQNASAEVRRQKYRSLLLNRRASSKRKKRVNSINLTYRDDILELTERSSSFRDSDSSLSLRLRRLSNKHKDNRVVRATSLALKNINKQRKKLDYATRSYDIVARDYSVDRTSDSLFKTFIRVDPQFEDYRPRTPTLPSRLRPVDHEYQSRSFSRSIDYYASFR